MPRHAEACRGACTQQFCWSTLLGDRTGLAGSSHLTEVTWNSHPHSCLLRTPYIVDRGVFNLPALQTCNSRQTASVRGGIVPSLYHSMQVSGAGAGQENQRIATQHSTDDIGSSGLQAFAKHCARRPAVTASDSRT